MRFQGNDCCQGNESVLKNTILRNENISTKTCVWIRTRKRDDRPYYRRQSGRLYLSGRLVHGVSVRAVLTFVFTSSAVLFMACVLAVARSDEQNESTDTIDDITNIAFANMSHLNEPVCCQHQTHRRLPAFVSPLFFRFGPFMHEFDGSDFIFVVSPWFWS